MVYARELLKISKEFVGAIVYKKNSIMLRYLAAAGLLLKVTLRNSNYTFSYPFLICLLYITYHKTNYFLRHVRLKNNGSL